MGTRYGVGWHEQKHIDLWHFKNHFARIGGKEIVVNQYGCKSVTATSPHSVFQQSLNDCDPPMRAPIST